MINKPLPSIPAGEAPVPIEQTMKQVVAIELFPNNRNVLLFKAGERYRLSRMLVDGETDIVADGKKVSVEEFIQWYFPAKDKVYTTVTIEEEVMLNDPKRIGVVARIVFKRQ